MPENTMTNIYHRFVFQAPISKVWSAVATSEGLEAWLMPNTFTPEPDSELLQREIGMGSYCAGLWKSTNRIVWSFHGTEITWTQPLRLSWKRRMEERFSTWPTPGGIDFRNSFCLCAICWTKAGADTAHKASSVS
jgi:uncharacterized protein YndB with AHSA1/START domain